MRFRAMILPLCLAAGISLSAQGLRAQEAVQEEADVAAKQPKRSPAGVYRCYSNIYSRAALNAIRNSYMAAEMGVLMGARDSDPCWPTYPVGPYDPYGGYGHMLSDGVARPERVSQKEVRAAWDASYRAAAEGRTTMTLGDAPVPPIRSTLSGQTLVLGVRPSPTVRPSMYDGIPILESGRSWERIQTRDGRSVWSYTEIDRAPSGRSVGGRYRDARSLQRSASGNRANGYRSSMGRAPRMAPVSPRVGSSASSAPRPSTSVPRPPTPRKGVEN